jgi:Fur family ferric uptake transcriptional regulator
VSPTTSRETLEQRRLELRRVGLRATASRLAVLARLQEATSPVSHAEVVAHFGDARWDRATLYRNLLDLVRSGLARRSDVGDHIWRFALVREAHPRTDHPHFVCLACGSVQCLPGLGMSVRAKAPLPVAVRQHEFEVQLKGLCDRCR